MASGRETVIPVPPTQDYDLKQIDWISLVGKTLHFQCRVQSLVAELRSHMLHSVAKKKKKKEEKQTDCSGNPRLLLKAEHYKEVKEFLPLSF